MSGVVNMLAFYGPKLPQVFTGTARMHDLTTALDEAIPFSPVWVIPYVLTFALWTYQYIMVTHDSEEMANRMFAADTLGKLSGGNFALGHHHVQIYENFHAAPS